MNRKNRHTLSCAYIENYAGLSYVAFDLVTKLALLSAHMPQSAQFETWIDSNLCGQKGLVNDTETLTFKKQSSHYTHTTQQQLTKSCYQGFLTTEEKIAYV